MSEDLFDGREDNEVDEGAYLKLNAPGALFQIKVTDLSDSFQAAHGEGYLVTGVLEVKRGDVEGPEVGDEGVYFVPLTTSQGKEHHITQEVKRACAKAQPGKRSLDIGDTLAIKFVEQLAPKKKGMSGFKKHAVVVKAGSPSLINEDEAPF
jgi:hypothetical protein